MNISSRGNKHHCASCGAPFYDLNKSPIICPKCHTPFQEVSLVSSRPASGRNRAKPVVPTPHDSDEEILGDTSQDDDVEDQEEDGEEDDADDDLTGT